MSNSVPEQPKAGLEAVINALAAGKDTNPDVRQEALNIAVGLRLQQQSILQAQSLGVDQFALERAETELARLRQNGYLTEPTPLISKGLEETRLALTSTEPTSTTSPFDVLQQKLAAKRRAEAQQESVLQTTEKIKDARRRNRQEIADMISETKTREGQRYLKRIGAIDLFLEAVKQIQRQYKDVEVDVFDPHSSWKDHLEARWNFRTKNLERVSDRLYLRAVTSDEIYGGETIEAQTTFIGVAAKFQTKGENGETTHTPVLVKPEREAIQAALVDAIAHPGLSRRLREKRNPIVEKLKIKWRIAKIRI